MKKVAPDVFIYSAFLDARATDLDERGPPGSVHIRMMAIAPSTARRRRGQAPAGAYTSRLPRLRCLFPLYKIATPNVSADMFLRSAVTYYKMTESEKTSQSGYILSCLLPPALSLRPPCEILVTDDAMDTVTAPWIKVDSQRLRLRSKRRLFTVCTPPLYGSINEKDLVEFIEVNRMLGASHFYFYDYNASASTIHVLAHYTDKAHVATVLPWKLARRFDASSVLWNNGRAVAINDCLYRSMARSEFVVFLDIDEILMPYSQMNWTEMTQNLLNKSGGPHEAGYVFRSVVFDPLRQVRNKDADADEDEYEGKGEGEFENRNWNLRSLTDTLRSSVVSQGHTRCLVNPRNVFYQRLTDVGRSITATQTQFLVDPTEAVVRHYRPCDAGIEGPHCAILVTDTEALQFASTLQNAVDKVLEMLWPDQYY